MLETKFGPLIGSRKSVDFRLWAPKWDHAELEITEGNKSWKSIPMLGRRGGWFEVSTLAEVGSKYWFRGPNGLRVADPASRFQPEGVHGPSQLCSCTSFEWSDAKWKGIKKRDVVLYELHIGTFTEDGTYRSASNRLPELVDLGITAIEIMPVAQAAGRWNWGYDGVNLFAPSNCYGSPDELRAFVDRAHHLGLAVILDVVYNHFGAEGNYLGPLGGYISTRHQTAWGDSPNFDGEGSSVVRDWVVENAAYWIEDFHFDGLRLDAVHCMRDDSPTHVVREIGERFNVLRTKLGRELHLMAESNLYDPSLLQGIEHGGYGFDSQWSDDFVHSVFSVLKPGEDRCHRVYEAPSDLAHVLRKGYVFHRTFYTPSQRITAPDAPPVLGAPLVTSIQNHDFVGNHPQGSRLHSEVGDDRHRAAAALHILSPFTPMLFMGEEFASKNPFYFFVDFQDEVLRNAVEVGRRNEYPQHNWNGSPSPVSDGAFIDSKVGPCSEGNQQTLEWYRHLIELRKRWIKEGLITADQVVRGRYDGRFAVWTFDNGLQQAFVVVGMSAPEHPNDRQVASVRGTMAMSQLAEELFVAESPSDETEVVDRQSFVVRDGTVLVGYGTVEFVAAPEGVEMNRTRKIDLP